MAAAGPRPAQHVRPNQFRDTALATLQSVCADPAAPAAARVQAALALLRATEPAPGSGGGGAPATVAELDAQLAALDAQLADLSPGNT